MNGREEKHYKERAAGVSFLIYLNYTTLIVRGIPQSLAFSYHPHTFHKWGKQKHKNTLNLPYITFLMSTLTTRVSWYLTSYVCNKYLTMFPVCVTDGGHHSLTQRPGTHMC